MKKLLLPVFAIVAISATLCFFTGCGKGGNTPEPTPPVVVAKITSLSPTSGTPGTVITITGTGFSTTSTNKVLFNGKDAVVTAATATALTVTVPADAGTGAVTVSVNGAAAVTGPVFTYIEPAKITSISVIEGAAYAGVIINGTGFSATASENKVYFNGKEATIAAATPTKLTVQVPVAAGSGLITVSVKGALAVTGPMFTYKLSYVSTEFAGGNGAEAGVVNGAGATARFSSIQGLAIDNADNIYVAESTYLIRKVTPGAVVSSYIGTGNTSALNGTLSNHPLLSPVAVTVDGTGNIYIAEVFFSVEKVTPGGAYSSVALPGDGGAALTPSPSGICTDQVGNVFIVDYAYNRILKLTPGGDISIFAGSASGTAGLANGAGSTALFHDPTSIAADKNGNLFVTDNHNQKIRKITPDGVVSNFVDISFYAINSLATDSDGNVYLGNASNLGQSQIVKITPDGQKIPLFTAANEIHGLAINKNNEIFYASLNSIRKLFYQ